MDMEMAKFALQLLEFIVVGACSIYVYIAAKNRVTNERINKMEDDISETLDGHGQRIARLEAHAEQAVTHADLGTLHERVNRVAEEIGQLAGKLGAVERLLNTIHDHLLRGVK